MNWFDVIIIIFLLWEVLVNARKGFLKNIFEVAILFLSIFCAFLLFGPTSVLFKAIFFKVPDLVSQIVCFTFLWCGFYFALMFVGDIIIKFWKVSPFGKIDTLLGGLLGLARGGLIVSLVILILIVLSFFSFLPWPIENGYRQSLIVSVTNEALTGSFQAINEMLLAQIEEKPSIFNQIIMLSNYKNPRPLKEKLDPKKIGSSTVEEITKVVHDIQSLQKNKN